MSEETHPIADGNEPATLASETAEEADARIRSWYEVWWTERRARGLALQQSSRRIWAAMDGWRVMHTQEDWERIRAEAAEDWASGKTLIEMVGGERYLAPERMALLLHLWRHFVVAYEVEGPAEYMVVAMALVAFDQFSRLNELIGNLETRLESEFFSTRGLQAEFEERYGRGAGARIRGLKAEEIVRQLGQEMLPLLDRCNRMVIRNLKMLRDLKTTPLALTVENYGQLNVGQRQTNLARPAGAEQQQG